MSTVAPVPGIERAAAAALPPEFTTVKPSTTDEFASERPVVAAELNTTT